MATNVQQGQGDAAESFANPNMVVTKTILERWHKDDTYCSSLSDIGWIDEQIIQCDDLALEDHSYIATREE